MATYEAAVGAAASCQRSVSLSSLRITFFFFGGHTISKFCPTFLQPPPCCESTNQLTERSPSREAYFSLANQEMFRIVRQPKVHYRIHKRT